MSLSAAPTPSDHSSLFTPEKIAELRAMEKAALDGGIKSKEFVMYQWAACNHLGAALDEIERLKHLLFTETETKP
jgi:hypothetical protein